MIEFIKNFATTLPRTVPIIGIGLLTLILFILKVTNIVAISWLWVFSPIWIVVSVATVGSVIIFGSVAVGSYFKDKKK